MKTTHYSIGLAITVLLFSGCMSKEERARMEKEQFTKDSIAKIERIKLIEKEAAEKVSRNDSLGVELTLESWEQGGVKMTSFGVRGNFTVKNTGKKSIKNISIEWIYKGGGDTIFGRNKCDYDVSIPSGGSQYLRMKFFGNCREKVQSIGIKIKGIEYFK